MCGKMAEELLSLKWNNHQAHFVDILTFLREQEIFVDATLACGGKLYAAHKFVLSTCSDYFKQMFTKNPSKHPIVFMKDVSTRDLEALLDFMYNGEVNVPQSSLGSLIKTAEGLQIKGLAVPDDPPAKRDRDKRDTKPPERLSPPPKRSRVRDNSPVHSLPSRSLAQSSYTPTPSSSSINRPRSPLPPTNTSSGPSQAPIEGTLDEDSRTSIQSGVSGLSEQNSSTTPSLSSKIGSSNQQIQSNTGDINSHLEQSGTEEPSPGPSGIQKQEIKQEDIVDLGEDDDEDWGIEGDAGGGDSSMGSEHPPSFPDVILPHGSDPMQGQTGDPAMWHPVGVGSLMSFQSMWSMNPNVASSHYEMHREDPLKLGMDPPINIPLGHESQKRRFPCKFCGKMFVRRSHVNQHERRHTGNMPFKCFDCNKGFVNKSHFDYHVQRSLEHQQVIRNKPWIANELSSSLSSSDFKQPEATSFHNSHPSPTLQPLGNQEAQNSSSTQIRSDQNSTSSSFTENPPSSPPYLQSIIDTNSPSPQQADNQIVEDHPPIESSSLKELLK